MKRHGFTMGCAIWLALAAAMAALGPPGKHPWIFGVLFLAAHGGMIYMAVRFPRRLGRVPALGLIFLLGLTARLFFLDFPVGNDVYRYVWEGAIQNLGFNPYLYPPGHPVLSETAAQELAGIWAAVNHKDYSAIYPPFSLLLFRLSAAVAPSPHAVKGLIWGFDFGLMVVLAKMLVDRDLPTSRLLLYAANPLVLVFVAGEGHLDVVQAFFLVGGLHLLSRRKNISGFTAIGLAVMTKYLSIVVLPFILNRSNWRQAPAVLLPTLLYLPFIEAGSHLFHSLRAFGVGMHYNDSITAVLRFFIGPSWAVLSSVAILAVCLFCIFLFVQAPERSAYLASASLLVCLPTLHPWYLVLLAPFMVFYPSRAWLFLQGAMAFTFPVLGVEYRTGVFQEIHGWTVLEYVPFYALLLYGVFRSAKWLKGDPFPAPESLSVIIPTLNEAGTVERCLEALRDRPSVAEVVVVDGRSSDATVDLAESYGVRVVVCEKGRGIQIAKGIEVSRGDIVTVLHADCLPDRGLCTGMLRAMRRDGFAVGGAVGMRFEDRRWPSRWIAALNNFRTRTTAIAFGDQAQFFRRSVLDAVGGFPKMMLMEDVEFSLRLKEIGPLIYIPEGIRVSSRRWQGDRFGGKVVTVMRLFFGFLIRRRWAGGQAPGPCAGYYRMYYSDR